MSPYYTKRRPNHNLMDTEDTTPLVTVVRNSYAHAWNRLCMLTVPKSVAEILNCLCKVMDGSPRTRKAAYGCQRAIQGQGRFTKCGLPWAIPAVVWMACKCYNSNHYIIISLGFPKQAKTHTFTHLDFPVPPTWRSILAAHPFGLHPPDCPWPRPTPNLFLLVWSCHYVVPLPPWLPWGGMLSHR